MMIMDGKPSGRMMEQMGGGKDKAGTMPMQGDMACPDCKKMEQAANKGMEQNHPMGKK